MITPYPMRARGGLRRVGFVDWLATDDDPHLTIALPRFIRPRHLLLVVDGRERRIETTVYLDRGAGFDESAAVSFAPSGRAICWLELGRMADVRRIRLDPSEEPGRVRIVALATPSRLAARWLARTFDRDRSGFGPTRLHKLSSARVDAGALGTGRETRRYRSVAEHYADVLAMAADRTVPELEPGSPLISFLVPTYNTDPTYLDALLASFQAQPPGMAEMILSDDCSTSPATLAWLAAHEATAGLKVVLGQRNRGIAGATNAALDLATAPWIGLADHDDALSPGAVAEIAAAIAGRPDARFIYTDEVVTDGDLKPVGYMLKPAYDPVLLSGVNYVNHLSLYRRDRLVALGGLREGFQGSQDYDLLLRYLDGIDPERVVHLPYPAYLWRRHETSFSTEFKQASVDSARRALGLAYSRSGKPAEVGEALLADLHRVRLDGGVEAWPKVSVVIPNRDSPALMDTVLRGLAATDYDDMEIVVADNDTRDPETLRVYEKHRAGSRPFAVEAVPGAFNFSRSVNRGVRRASGDLLLLLNNDIEIREPGWLKEMVSCFGYGGVGIVGARLLYPDRTLQHAGVIVGLGGLAGHWYGGKPDTFWGPMGRLAVRQSLSAVTGAAMLVSRTCFDRTGPFDEEKFAIAYNDVDFCLRAREEGFRVVWTPFATLIHHESASRGSDESADKIERFSREKRNLRERHATAQFRDPAYNPWHDVRSGMGGLRALDALPSPR